MIITIIIIITILLFYIYIYIDMFMAEGDSFHDVHTSFRIVSPTCTSCIKIPERVH